MACILKLPSKQTKGVLSLTSVEKSRIVDTVPAVRERLEGLKGRWLIGQHQNWQDFEYVHDDLFDFVMCAQGAIRAKDDKVIPLVPISALHFTPVSFRRFSSEKYWDVLHISRLQDHKNIEGFFEVIRHLFDLGHELNVLLFCTIPDKTPKQKNGSYQIRQKYEEMFTAREKDMFAFLTTDYRNPYPFSSDFVAQFYNNSKVLLNTGLKEAGGRISAYAWACGMPVVALNNIGLMLPADQRKEPCFYGTDDTKDLPKLVLKAIEEYDPMDTRRDELVNLYSEQHGRMRLKKKLGEFLMGEEEGEDLYQLTNVGIRIGRHIGIGNNITELPWKLTTFLDLLPELDSKNLDDLLGSSDIENELLRPLPKDLVVTSKKSPVSKILSKVNSLASRLNVKP